jgi:hypothetical protein
MCVDVFCGCASYKVPAELKVSEGFRPVERKLAPTIGTRN